jgi:hypothetical protein
MDHADFKIGTEFRYRALLWRCTDVGSRTVVAICLSEAWVTKTKVNTGVKERVRLSSTLPMHFEGPPYQVEEVVIAERAMSECISADSWNAAKKVLGI